ncbi:MAG: hypothetical protein GX660_20870 [Clostridiaceae bacterium]|nr:hypothetical protein [Clostridiaceae bacterium]
MFATKYDKRDNKKTEPGSRYAPVFSLASKEAGNIELEITGEKDIYAEIQSHKDSVSIKTIMARYELGEVDLLNKKNGVFIDLSDMPTNFADIMKTVITAENNFNELPLSVRKEYNFSPAEYIADIGSEKWLKILGIKDNKEAKTIGESHTEEKSTEEKSDE